MKPSMVISLGGSIVAPENIDTKFLEDFKELMLSVREKYEKIIFVIGGGHFTRYYQSIARELNHQVDNDDLDNMGIRITRVNSHLLKIGFGEYAYPEIIEQMDEKVATNHQFLFSAGMTPGNSTDYIAVKFAELYEVDTVLNLSNMAYVYDSDPKKNPDAKPQEKLTWEQMKAITGGEWIPGKHTPFDPKATELAAELGLTVVFMNGTNLSNLKEYFESNSFEGSTVK